MTFYSDMADVAVELLAEFGKTITLERITGGSTNPVTGVVTPGSEDNQETVGVIKPYKQGLIDGTVIKVGDKWGILSPEVEPLYTDKIEGMQIVNIDKIDPAGTVLAYKLQVRS